MPADTKWSDDSFLDKIRDAVDTEADGCHRKLAGAGDLNFEFSLLKTNKDRPTDKARPALREFLETTRPIPLINNTEVDGETLKRGQRVFMRHSMPAALVLLAKALTEGYAAPCLSRVLAMTGNLKQQPFRRLMGVLQMVVHVTSVGGFEDEGSAIVTAQKIRLLHAGLRLRVAPKSLPEYEEFRDRHQEPINLEDMLATIMGFSYLIIAGFRTLKIGLSREQEEDYYYLWRVFAQMMGIHPPGARDSSEWIPATVAEAEEFYRSYERRHYAPAEANREGMHLARENVDLIAWIVERTPLLRVFGPETVARTYVQTLLGEAACKRVGVRVQRRPIRGPVLAMLPALLARGGRALDLLGLGRWRERRSRARLQRMIVESQGAEVTFLVPQTAEDLRKLVTPDIVPPHADSAAVLRAKTILATSKVPETRPGLIKELVANQKVLLEDLVKKLKGESKFGLARRVLELVPEADAKLAVVQELSLCTYKDTELPTRKALDGALNVLEKRADLSNSKDPETLGQAGAIHKRRFELDGHREHLELSHIYYGRGHEEGAARKQGYCGINAAFILDLLASLEWDVARKVTPKKPRSVSERQADARDIRAQLLDSLDPALNWRVAAKIAEVSVGLGDYARAAQVLQPARGLMSNREAASVARQLSVLIRVKEGKKGLAEAGWGQVLGALFGDGADAMRPRFTGEMMNRADVQAAGSATDSPSAPRLPAMPEVDSVVGRDEAVRLARTLKGEDDQLPDLQALNLALQILEKHAALPETKDAETLDLAGDIHQRRFYVDGEREHLTQARDCYWRGYQLGPEENLGSCGIGAAFVLDLLSNLESDDARKAGAPEPRSVGQRRNDAVAIRRKVRGIDPMANWWLAATIAEAYAGQGNYDAAAALLKAARATASDWERESTARQLASLIRIREGEDGISGSGPALVFDVLLSDRADAIQTIVIGKIGLALSGGGFRASLYHIGVLARLAETNMLRHVEVLSCVSGGSIIGAQYYLEIARLLDSKPDRDITAEDYVRIVQKIEGDFLRGVEGNIRTRIYTSPLANLRVALGTHSGTRRAGELYERQLFALVPDGRGKKRRHMSQLRITPRDDPNERDFDPTKHNWRRRAKVPILILNATTLNTGHNWQFTVSWMGEPPEEIEADVDSNYRLRRLYYGQAPRRYREFRLGTAVAASACVPGLFRPVALPGLYERPDGDAPKRPIDVQLVDGGVHDNQGIAGLLSQSCKAIIVSDASGQDSSVDSPRTGFIRVSTRSNGILQSRVRLSQFRDLVMRRDSRLLNALAFVHLKKGLPSQSIDWVQCQDPQSTKAGEESVPDALLPRVPQDLQALLAGIRTDLDSFSEVEAYGLMYSGYEMMTRELERLRKERVLPWLKAEFPGEWRFLAVRDALADAGSAEYRRLRVALGAGASRFFRWFRIELAGMFGGTGLLEESVRAPVRLLVRVWYVLLAVLGPLFGGFHLLVTHRLFLSRGRLRRFVRRSLATEKGYPTPQTLEPVKGRSKGPAAS